MLYPAPSSTRTVINLSGNWQFQVADDTTNPTSPLPHPRWTAVPASLNAQDLDPAVRNHVGQFWYQTNLSIPAACAQQTLTLRFEAVAQAATVYLNGHRVGHHQGGYTPFDFTIDDFVHAGSNDLKVLVDNRLDNTTVPTAALNARGDQMTPRFDFINFFGINRPVYLIATNPTHLVGLTIPYQLTADQATLTPHLTVQGTYDHGQLTIQDAHGHQVAQTTKLQEPLIIKSPHRWHPGAAYLYQLTVRLYDAADQLLDEYTKPFGLRTVTVKDGQFLINDRPFYFKGFGWHEDSLARGGGQDLALTNLDLQIMQKMGANSFRTSHYPYAEETMRQADRLGFVVIDEVPAVGLFTGFNVALAPKRPDQPTTWQTLDTLAAHQQALHEMIARDGDHPAACVWSVANEAATHEAGAREYFKQVIAYTRQQDWQPRPITAVNIMVATPDKDQVGDLLDLICLNRYYGWYADFNQLDQAQHDLKAELTAWHQKLPTKPIVMTEFGADTVPGNHSLTHAPYSEEYQQDYYRANFAVFDQCPFVTGEQVWAFADFAVDPSLIRISGQNLKGIFTRDRQPKGVAHLLATRWHRK